jgi:hypothetical protein
VIYLRKSNAGEHLEHVVLPLPKLRQPRHSQSEHIHAIGKRDRAALRTPPPPAPPIPSIISIITVGTRPALEKDARALQPRRGHLAALLHEPDGLPRVLLLDVRRLTADRGELAHERAQRRGALRESEGHATHAEDSAVVRDGGGRRDGEDGERDGGEVCARRVRGELGEEGRRACKDVGECCVERFADELNCGALCRCDCWGARG